MRYVLDRSAVDPESRDGRTVGSVATKTTDTFINAEVSILQSWDLAVQVAEALGPKRVFPDAKGDPSINERRAPSILASKSLLQKIVTLFKFPILILDQESQFWS